MRASSYGKRFITCRKNRRLISKMIVRCRGSSLPKTSTGQVSSASASSVWFV